MFIARLNEASKNLTYSEKSIARLITSNFKNFEIMTSDQIAKRVGVGQATVIRFSKKLGYSGFKSMIADIRNDAAFFTSSEVQDDEGMLGIMEKMRNAYETSLVEVQKNSDVTLLEQAVKALEGANKIFCYGVRTSNAIANTLYYRLLEVGEVALRADNVFEATSIARHLGKNDVLFIVSISGETAEAVTVAEIAKRQNAVIISITGGQENSIEHMSTIALKSAEYDLRTEQRFNLVNRCSILYLMDCIFMKLWKDNEARFRDQIDELVIDSSISDLSSSPTSIDYAIRI